MTTVKGGEPGERFVGRRRELEMLEQAWAARASGLLPIYGRRRVGKSELILQLLRRRPGIYHLGKQVPAALLIREFLREAAVVLAEPLLAAIAVDGWKAALKAVVDRWRGDGKLVIALDEFQWTVESSPELPSVIQELWDLEWRKSGRVLLILCGSYIGFMEREVLGKKSPLFGRRTGQLLLRPFSFAEAASFHPSYSVLDRARTYFLCGGIPLYLKCFATDRSVEDNIARNFLDEFATLYREPDFLLREEMREVQTYYAVLHAVAAGHATNSEIARQLEMGAQNLHYYLKQLVELGYLAARYPLSGRRPTARQIRYSVEDPLLRFWFRFVLPNTSFIMQMGARRALADLIRPELASYFGGGFERLCREALPRLYEREGVTSAFQVGEYWAGDVQIDVVGLRGDGWTDIGECKWGPVRSSARLVAELEAKVAAYPNPRGATVGRRVFTREPIAAKARRGAGGAAVRWHNLEEMYALE